MSKLIKQAFTLIELLVVIAIIGILSGLIVVSMGGMTTKANIAKTQVFSNSLRNSLLLNLVSEWKFDDGTGTIATDSWNGGNNLTLLDKNGACSTTLCPQWQTVDCVYGKCLSFNGVGSYGEISGSNTSTSNLAITGAITLSAWVKFNVAGIDGAIVGRGAPWWGDGNYGYSLVRNVSNLIYFSTYSTTTHDYLVSSAVSDTNWHLVVATWDGTTNLNGKKIYIDGILNNQKTSVISAMGQPVYYFRVGADCQLSLPLNGSIDEVRVYNAAVPISQIKEQYYTGLNSLLDNGSITSEEYLGRIDSLAKF